ncbi:MAG: hypothetical protein QM628_00340 [Propionicimonas sp.]
MSDLTGWGGRFRGLRTIIQARNGPAELASADRLVAGADQLDVSMASLSLSVSDTLGAMDGLLAAVFDGLTEEESIQMLQDESMQTILGARDRIATWRSGTTPL